MSLEECYRKRLLRRGRPDKLKAKKAIEIAEQKLDRATELFDHNFPDEAMVASYTAMLQSAKALLFKDGVFEKSHWCVIEYLRENYVKKRLLEPSHVNWLDIYRQERHRIMYGLKTLVVSDEDIKDALDKTRKFIDAVKKIV